jgi:hypothetical protein
MAGVAGIFFVLLTILLIQAEIRAKRAEAERAVVVDVEKERKDAARYVQESLALIASRLASSEEGNVTAAQNGDVLNVDIDPARKLFVFEQGDYQLPVGKRPQAIRLLRSVLSTVCDVVTDRTRGPQAIFRIVLEGHTDNQGYGALCNEANDASCRFGENVALSGRRAVSILRLVYETNTADAERDQALRSCIESVFLITGRGPVDPLGAMPRPDGTRDWRAPQTVDEQQENRRVVLRVEGRRDLDVLVEERRAHPGTVKP